MSPSGPCTETLRQSQTGPWAWLARRVQTLQLPAGALKKRSSKTFPSSVAQANLSETSPSSPQEVSPALLTCVLQDRQIHLKVHKDLPRVGHLQSASLSATLKDRAHVQDIVRQVNAGRRSKDSP